MATADWFVVQGQALQTASNLAGLHPQHLLDPLYWAYLVAQGLDTVKWKKSVLQKTALQTLELLVCFQGLEHTWSILN